MNLFHPLRSLNTNTLYKEGDVFVLFGELFGRGYANGLIEEARKRGMRIIGVTVGRRDADRTLRPLNMEELLAAEENLGGKIINIPMEAGFDMEEAGDILSPVEMMKNLKPDNWTEFNPNEADIEIVRKKGAERFRTNIRTVLNAIKAEIRPGNNVHFAHIMAGGVPRAKIILLLANRVFKTKGDKYIASAKFWNSGIGMLVRKSFEDVTAGTFKILLEESETLRKEVQTKGGQVRYSAYGYHGTEIYLDGSYQWQTYTPYQQGHAKKLLEDHAAEARRAGIAATVYNCPEIRTNSSDIFVGVELSLFPLITALKKSGTDALYNKHRTYCAGLLKTEHTPEQILELIENYLKSDLMKSFRSFEQWPMENTPELAELMINTSEEITAMHTDPKLLISDYLSSLVLKGSGPVIFNDIADTTSPVLWLGHDIIARALTKYGD